MDKEKMEEMEEIQQKADLIQEIYRDIAILDKTLGHLHAAINKLEFGVFRSDAEGGT